MRKQGSRWVAYIIRPSVGGETNLGIFNEEVDAAKQYDKYANVSTAVLSKSVVLLLFASVYYGNPFCTS